MGIRSIKDEELNLLIREEEYEEAGFLSSKYIEVYEADQLEDIITQYDSISKERHLSYRDAYKSYVKSKPELIKQYQELLNDDQEFLTFIKRFYNPIDEFYLDWEKEVYPTIWRSVSPTGKYKPTALFSLEDIKIEYDGQNDVEGYLFNYGIVHIIQNNAKVESIVDFDYISREEIEEIENASCYVDIRPLPLEFKDEQGNFAKGEKLVEIITIGIDDDEDNERERSSPIKPSYQRA